LLSRLPSTLVAADVVDDADDDVVVDVVVPPSRLPRAETPVDVPVVPHELNEAVAASKTAGRINFFIRCTLIISLFSESKVGKKFLKAKTK